MKKFNKSILLASLSAILLSSCSSMVSVDPNEFSFEINPSQSSVPEFSSEPTSREPSIIEQNSTEESYSRPTDPTYSNSFEVDPLMEPEPPHYAIPDLKNNKKITDFNIIDHDPAKYVSLATDYIAAEIGVQGYEVFKAYAVILDPEDSNNILYYLPGLAFTDGVIYSDENDMLIYSCGFIQIKEKGKDLEYTLTDENVSEGILVLPAFGDVKTYVIESNTVLEGFSGIYLDTFFSYKQVSSFVVEISVGKNDISNYDDELDIYDFDKEEYLYKASIFQTKEELNAFALYGRKASEAYKAAIETIDNLIRIQDENGTKISLSSTVVVSQDLLDMLLLDQQRESLNGYLQSYLDSIYLEDNQYLTLTADGGISVNTDYSYQTAKDRTADGLVKTLVSMGILYGGYALLSFATAGTSNLVLAGIAFVAGGSTTAFGMGELFEHGSDLYYGMKGDTTTHANNPVKEKFQEVFDTPQDHTVGEKIYHIWGIISTISTTFFNPIAKGLEGAAHLGFGVLKTALVVTRIVVVKVVEAAITAGAATIVGSITSKLVLKATDNVIVAKLAGLAASVITGILVYRGLDSLDNRYDFSGLKRLSIRQVHRVVDEPDNEIGKIEEELGMEPGPYNRNRRFKNINDAEGDGQMNLVLEKNYSSATNSSKAAVVEDTFSKLAAESNVSPKTHIEYFDYGEQGVLPFFMSKRRAQSEDVNTGFYDYETKTIYINSKVLKDNGEQALYTMAHLLRHAYQFEKAKEGSTILSSLEIENYYIGTSNPAEQDADAYARYVVQRAHNAKKVLDENPDTVYVENPYTYTDSDAFRK